jgi:hypothetical protein
MFIHEEISAPDTVSKLPVARDAELQVVCPPLRAALLPRDPWGGRPVLSGAAVLTILVGELKDKARLY